MTSARVVSTHPTHDTLDSLSVPDLADGDTGVSAGSGVGAEEPEQQPHPPARVDEDRALRALRAVGFHLLAIALFAVPAVVLWWHVWSGHPSSTLTCGCGDPAQQVWFTAWPAWAIEHLHSLFFSGAVNVPDGANLLSNTSGTLVGVVLAPVTWLFGPVTATNVALTLAPALSAWGCFAAIRPLVTWKPAAIPAALVYGYSSAIVTSLVFGHVSVTMLVLPPFLFTTLHEIVVRQQHSVRRDGLVLAALLVAQFLISPEVLVMCGLLAVVGLVAVLMVGRHHVRARARHAARALGLAVGVTVVLLAYPAWFGVAGPQSVSGTLFYLAPIAGVPLSGLLAPGQYEAFANAYVRFGGYLGRVGPPPDYVGGGVALVAVGSAVLARRRPLTWLLVFMAAVSLLLALGGALLLTPTSLTHVWLPWRALSKLPVLKEILADQFAPFLTLFLAFLIAVGLDAFYVSRRPIVRTRRRHARRTSWIASHPTVVTAVVTAAVGVVALVPVFVTFDVPFAVVPLRIPAYMRQVAPTLPSGTVLLTVPFAVSGSTQPMLWQAVDDMHVRLAGAALKTPNAVGGPVGQGAPGSARRILTDLSLVGAALPSGTPAQVAAVRRALVAWEVEQVVIAGTSRDPVYASGFFTKVIGTVPDFVRGAWVWTLPPGGPTTPPAMDASLALCRAAAAAPGARGQPLAMARCVLPGTG